MRKKVPWDTGDLSFLTAGFATISPVLQYLFGDVPAFQAFIAEVEVVE